MASQRQPDPIRVLPRGRHAAPRDVVTRSQRERLLAAISAAVAERGYARTAVADVLAGAGVSRKSFYEQFANKEDCFLAAYDLGVDRVLQAIDDAIATAADPAAAPAAGVHGYLASLVEHPDFARTFLIEALGAGPAALERRAVVHERFAEQFRRIYDGQRAALPELPELPPLRFRACVGAVDELVVEHVRLHGTDGLERLAEPLIDVVIGLLVGHETFARLRG
jgi:AcrR family transcriptional regulator